MKFNFKTLLMLIVLASSAWFTFKEEVKLGLDLKGGAYAVLEAQPTGKEKEVTAEEMEKLIEVLTRRVNAFGLSEATVQKSGLNRAIVQLPGAKNTEEAISQIGKPAYLEFKIVQEGGTLGKTLLTGKALEKAEVIYDKLGRPQIAFKMNLKASKIFAKITAENIGEKLAITLDGKLQTAPTIQTEIAGGSGTITGTYTADEAKNLATLLNAGALPVKVEILETRTVGASLGNESIEKSKKAAIIAVALIAIFMLIFYRLPGIVANIALAIFGIIAFGTLNYFGFTLTLPGIAGFVLSIGMAVDANVIIFERIKEEMRNGNSVLASVDSGFKKAFITILDSNVTTLIITAILYSLGTGAVKGFAITLSIGILASMFTAIVVTKVLLKLFISGLKMNSTVFFGVRGK